MCDIMSSTNLENSEWLSFFWIQNRNTALLLVYVTTAQPFGK